MAYLYKKDNNHFVYRRIKDADDIKDEIIAKFHVDEIDEILGEPIKILNNKGYTTKTSCSSQYLKDASIKFINDDYKYDGSYVILGKKVIED